MGANPAYLFIVRFPPLTPFVKKLIILLVGVFVGLAIFDVWFAVPATRLLALTTDLGIHTIWQLFTHPFITPPQPSSVMGLIISLVFIWWMLSPFEHQYGRRRLIQLCLFGTFASALPALAVGQFLGNAYMLYGFDVWAMAAIGAMVWSNRHRDHLSFFGVLTLKPMMFLYLFAGIDLLVFLVDRNPVRFVASLGSLGGGIAFSEWMTRPLKPKPSKKPRRKNDLGFKVIDGGKSDEDERPKYLN